MSRGERPFIDIFQDRRYWIIHLVTIPSLFLGGSIFVLSGFAYKVFGTPKFTQYYQGDSTLVPLLNDRFSVASEVGDV